MTPMGNAGTNSTSTQGSPTARTEAEIQTTVANLVQRVPEGQHLQALLYTFNSPTGSSLSDFVVPYDAERVSHKAPDFRFSNGIRLGLAAQLKDSDKAVILPLLSQLAKTPNLYPQIGAQIRTSGAQLLKAAATDAALTTQAAQKVVDAVPDGQHMLAFLWTWGGPGADDDGNEFFPQFKTDFGNATALHSTGDHRFETLVKQLLISRMGSEKSKFDGIAKELEKPMDLGRFQHVRTIAWSVASEALIKNRQLPYSALTSNSVDAEFDRIAFFRITDVAVSHTVSQIPSDRYAAHAMLITLGFTWGDPHVDKETEAFFKAYQDEIGKLKKSGLEVADYEAGVSFSLIGKLPDGEDKEIIRVARETLGLIPADDQGRAAIAAKMVKHINNLIDLQYVAEGTDPGYEEFAARANATTTTTSTTVITTTTGTTDPTFPLDRL